MIKVLFFAFLKDAAGTDSVSIHLSGEKVGTLKQRVAEQFKLNNLDTVMVAVNEEFADDETVLAEGDTVAFIPPVSGG